MDLKRLTAFRLRERHLMILDRWARQMDTDRTKALESVLDALSQMDILKQGWNFKFQHRPTKQIVSLYEGEYGK